jgi:hypothetical protein
MMTEEERQGYANYDYFNANDTSSSVYGPNPGAAPAYGRLSYDVYTDIADSDPFPVATSSLGRNPQKKQRHTIDVAPPPTLSIPPVYHEAPTLSVPSVGSVGVTPAPVLSIPSHNQLESVKNMKAPHNVPPQRKSLPASMTNNLGGKDKIKNKQSQSRIVKSSNRGAH